jgi:hypothetical protein
MAWVTPKTDWAIQPVDEYGRYNGDWFNWRDYERIRENIEFLAAEGFVAPEKMWTMDEIVSEYPEYTGYADGATITDRMRYAAPVIVEKQINPIERNLDILANNIIRPDDYPATKTWVGNGITPTFEDINRWENCCQIIFDILQSITIVGRKLPFTLNGGALSGV